MTWYWIRASAHVLTNIWSSILSYIWGIYNLSTTAFLSTITWLLARHQSVAAEVPQMTETSILKDKCKIRIAVVWKLIFFYVQRACCIFTRVRFFVSWLVCQRDCTTTRANFKISQITHRSWWKNHHLGGWCLWVSTIGWPWSGVLQLCDVGLSSLDC